MLRATLSKLRFLSKRRPQAHNLLKIDKSILIRVVQYSLINSFKAKIKVSVILFQKKNTLHKLAFTTFSTYSLVSEKLYICIFIHKDQHCRSFYYAKIQNNECGYTTSFKFVH